MPATSSAGSTCGERGPRAGSRPTSTPTRSATTSSPSVDHLATRDWSTGAVGMFGTSYGGFTSLQVAAERPPALKAIVPIFASDDRYTDDVHHFGGALKQLDVVDYPTYMVAMNALPPVPQIWGEGWREEWDRRVDALEPWVLPWIEHQRRDALLAPGFGPRVDRRHRGRDDDRGRMGRRIHEHRVPLVPPVPRAGSPADRPVGARRDGDVAAGAEHRSQPRARALVRPMAEGDRQRHRPRAADRRVRTALHRARSPPPRGARRMAIGAGMAAGPRGPHGARAREGGARRPRVGGRWRRARRSAATSARARGSPARA